MVRVISLVSVLLLSGCGESAGCCSLGVTYCKTTSEYPNN